MLKFNFENLNEVNAHYGKTIELPIVGDVCFLRVKQINSNMYILNYEKFDDMGQVGRTVREIPIHKDHFDSIIIDDTNKLKLLYKLIK